MKLKKVFLVLAFLVSWSEAVPNLPTTFYFSKLWTFHETLLDAREFVLMKKKEPGTSDFKIYRLVEEPL